MSSTHTADTQDFEEALKNCESEPIHQIGKIQPHGAMLVFSSDARHIVLQASDNLGELLDLPQGGAHGKSLAELIGLAVEVSLFERLITEARSNNSASGLVNVISHQKNCQRRARIFVSGPQFVLELMSGESDHQSPPFTEQMLKMQYSLLTYNVENRTYNYFNQVVSAVSELTGFDRVLVYRFEANWDGEVIAEKKVDESNSFLGLRFPASDIPPQARQLYTANLVRFLADTEAEPVKISPFLNPVSGLPLDLSNAILRSFSPIHIEYLRNMGVRASMSISLLQNGRLWGLITCHHLKPKLMSSALLEASSFISQIISAKLSLLEVNEQRNLNNEKSRIVAELMKSITADGEDDIYKTLLTNLLFILDASGVILVTEGVIHVHGQVPSSDSVAELLDWLKSHTEMETFSCDHLALHFPPAKAYSDFAAGLLVTPVTHEMSNSIIWFRREKLRTVHWAGNKEKTLIRKSTGVQLSPRKSFESWKEIWRGRSNLWTYPEIEIANSIAPLIARGLIQKHNLVREQKQGRVSSLKLHESEQALHESESWFRAVIENSDDAIVGEDLDGQIISWNPAAEKMFGYAPKEVIGRFVNILYPPNLANHEELDFLEQIRHGNRISHYESERICRNGQIISVSISISPIRGISGNIIGASKIVRDITLQKEARRALVRDNESLEALILARTLEVTAARDEATRANQAKNSFLANMSHEIRTPITAVIGFSALAQRADLPLKAASYFKKINTAATSLLGIINDILDFSKIEAGKLDMEVISFNLDEVFENINNLFGNNAREKGIELTLGSASGVPVVLSGDPLRLTQVLTNLLSNAIKFTEKGEITLLVELIKNEGDIVELQFVVKDTGIGMTPEQLASIFKPFAQADNSITRKYGGTGLGLVICQQLVELMGGKIFSESQVGYGTRIGFNALFGAETDNMTASQSFAGKRVMVVDDSPVMRKMVMAQLRKLGCESVEVYSSFALIAKLQSGEQTDCIIMDWHMPDMDGVDTARKLRNMGITLPIMLITGDEPELARVAAGQLVNEIVAKPISTAKLNHCLRTLFGGTKAAQEANSQSVYIPDLSGLRILLVDDNEFNREIGTEFVALTKAVVVTANDGQQAVDAVLKAENNSQENFNLILMDIQMPVMDGYVAAKIIKARFPLLPIVALTADVTSQGRDLIIESGMNYILTKPIDNNKLYRILSKLMRPHTTMPEEIVQIRQDKSTPTALTQSVDAWLNLPGFDSKAALDRMSGNRAMYRKFLLMFRDRNAFSPKAFHQALQQADLTDARRMIHTLKGTADSVGAAKLAAAAENLQLEFDAAQHSAQRVATQSVQKLETEWTLAMASLSTLSA